MAEGPVTPPGKLARPELGESVEAAHRIIATAMLISAMTVAISQHWFLLMRRWVQSRVAKPGSKS